MLRVRRFRAESLAFRKFRACAVRRLRMEVLHSIVDLESLRGPLFLAIGVFDGVHLGHQGVISTATSHARSADGAPVVVTLNPHRVKVLRPHNEPDLLTAT